ncbi:unnamed protein product [Rotaria sordida]|uniref:glutamyl aminopeptidase n=1 Tax=Rotaria sordida TaxID=392033 RepID=A0A815J3X5_9BILA|nr:unnamed protein product [Rotaria sordida]CAF1374166.1 unnamed protein product [Rotaria sordida]
MQSFDQNEKHVKLNTYQISKKLFWFILSLIIIGLVVLLVLTIYFGVRSQKTTIVYHETTLLSTSTHNPNDTTTSIGSTTTIHLIRPVERIPMNLKPELYQWTITPDLIQEKFVGDLLYTFTCLESTKELIFHMVDLNIDNSTIAIVNSSSSSIPIFDSWYYDDHNQFMKINFLSNFQPAMIYTLHIVYSANIDRDLEGIYLSDYVDVNGVSRTFITSQMEPTYARNVLPCIDEPARKALFRITVNHDPSYAVWTNTELEHSDTLSDGRINSYFAPTLNMSTYLLALIITPKLDFACRPDRIINSSKNIISRICGRIPILQKMAYADDVAFKAVNFFNQYFDIDYALPKIDHFAVPDFEGGAMENYGLLIYGEIGLFFDEKIGSTSQQQYVTLLIAHEVAHQWFGNLVSPAWWGELWLKEGFANYMESLATDFIEPSWKQDELFVIDKVFSFMKVDSLPTSRPISIEINNLADIFLMYDQITYNKGSSLIRMMKMFLGAEIFQQGIRNYLKHFSYSSATQHDLWQYLSAATNNTIDVELIMNGWTHQAGYPIVEINRIYRKIDQNLQQQQQRVSSELIITQQPFNLFPSTPTSKTWWIPFKYFDRTSLEFSKENPIEWFNSTSTRLSITTSDSDWIIANPDYFGLYRVKYDSKNFNLILAQLQTDHTRIPNINRAALIDDTFAISRTFLINATEAYKLIGYLKNENDFVPWTAAFSAMNQQEYLLGDNEIFPEVQRYFLNLILPLYNSISWTTINQTTDWRRALIQPELLSAVCSYGYRDCIDTARSMFRRWYLNPVQNEIPGSLRAVVYCVAIREGSHEEFQFLWKRLEDGPIPSATLDLLHGLACTRDRSQIIWFLNQHLKNESVIREQDITYSISNVARSRDSYQIAWIWIQENWPNLFSRWGKTDSGLDQVIDDVTNRFVTIRQLNDFNIFANSIIDKGTVYRQFQLSQDKINAAITWNTVNIASITAFIQSLDDSSISNYRLPSFAIPLHYDLYVKPYLNVTDNVDHSVFDGQVRIHINITNATDHIILHKRSIIIREPIENTGEVSIVETTFNQDRDLYTIIFDRIIPINTQINLTLNYRGQLSNEVDGFFLSSYVRSSDQVPRYLLASTMAPISARRALPCFDEPNFKATFSLSVEHESQYGAWSNMPIENQVNLSNGLILTHFQKSVSMSSYLLALVVADFECLARNNTGLYGNITTRVCAQPDKKDDLHYALEIATQNIHNFEKQYQINYPLTKCDHIALPKFFNGAMENFGCIMYFESRLLYNNITSTPLNKQDVALFIAHELSHQWFGNLVTHSWWNDVWLNEGFAEWMAFVGTNKVHPDWNSYEQHIAQEWFPIMQNDAISFSLPITRQITHDEQLNNIYNSLVYLKGSSLVRMMQNFIIEDTFNREKIDLWQILNEQMIIDNILLPRNISLGDIMNTWTDQMGYPYIEVIRDYSTNIISISQHQFLFDVEAQPPNSPYNYQWYIPFQFKSLSSSSSSITWFNEKQINIIIDANIQSNEWILANPNLLGFFRTNYDIRNWQMIIEQLKNDHKNFTIIERAGLVDDLFNLARINILPLSLVFDMLIYVKSEQEYIVWERIIVGIQYIEQMLATSYSNINIYEQWRSYLIDLIRSIYIYFGWNSQSMSEKWIDTVYRNVILSTACQYNLKNCTDYAQQLFQEWFNHPSNNTIEINYREIIYCTNIRLGSRTLFQFLFHQYQITNDTQEISRLQLALTCTQDIQLIRYLLEIHFNSNLNIIRQKDILSGIRLICRNSIGINDCWSYVRLKWKYLLKIFGHYDFISFIQELTEKFNTKQQLNEFELFIEQTMNQGSFEVEFRSSIERIRANIQWITNVKPNLEKWFANQTLTIDF